MKDSQPEVTFSVNEIKSSNTVRSNAAQNCDGCDGCGNSGCGECSAVDPQPVGCYA